MLAPKPAEFRRRAVELARLREKLIREIAQDLGIAESCVRRWTKANDVGAGRTEGTTTDEHSELVRLRRELRVARMEIEILKRASAYFACEVLPDPRIAFRLVSELDADGVPVAVTCRVLGVSRSGFYEWLGRPPSVRTVADAELTSTISKIHAGSRATYGAPRVHAELRLSLGWSVGRKRVARPMRAAGLFGVCHRCKHRRGGPAPAVHEDLLRRQFTADAPDRLWATDIAEHPTAEGKVNCAAIIDAYARTIVGWSIADHMRTELVVGILKMARWRRKPGRGDRALQTWIPVHVLDLRPPAPLSGVAGVDGEGRLQRGQHDDRELVVDHAARAA